MVKDEPLILVLYVDDPFLTGSSGLIKDCKRKSCRKIQHEGLEAWQKNGEIFLGQGRYATDILKRFKMQDWRPMTMPMITNWKKIDASGDKEVDPTLYRQLIGSLMYLVNTRPNICFAVNILSQFMVELKRVHWVATRHILRYVRDIVGYGFKYTQGDDVRLCGFIDANWEGSSVDRKNTSRYCFNVAA